MKQILIIDDDRFILKILSEILENSGYEWLTASNGEEGIRILNDNQPQLIITDISMPKVDENSAAEFIRNSLTLRDIPVVAITGAKGVVKEELFDGVLRKPFKREQLLSTIETLI